MSVIEVLAAAPSFSMQAVEELLCEAFSFPHQVSLLLFLCVAIAFQGTKGEEYPLSVLLHKFWSRPCVMWNPIAVHHHFIIFPEAMRRRRHGWNQRLRYQCALATVPFSIDC